MNLYNGTDNDINIIDSSAIKYNKNINNCFLLREDNYISRVIKQNEPLKIHENPTNRSLGTYDGMEVFMPSSAVVNRVDVPENLSSDHIVIVSQYYANIAVQLNHGIVPYLYTTYGKVKDEDNKLVGCIGLQKVHLSYPGHKVEAANTASYLVDRLVYSVNNRGSNPAEVVLALRILLSNYFEIINYVNKDSLDNEISRALIYLEDNEIKLNINENKIIERIFNRHDTEKDLVPSAEL